MSIGFGILKTNFKSQTGSGLYFEPVYSDFIREPVNYINESAGLIAIPNPGSRGYIFRAEIIGKYIKLASHISAEVAESYVNELFKCDQSPNENDHIPKMMSFITDILNRTKLSTTTVIVALYYLERLKKMHPSSKGNHGSGHRLLLSAIMVASKFLYDDSYDNKTWCLVSNLYKLQEINQMESELLYFLQYRLIIIPEDYERFVCMIEEKMLKNIRYKNINSSKCYPLGFNDSFELDTKSDIDTNRKLKNQTKFYNN